MSDPYERVKGGRLTFKGGALATRKSIDKKHKKHKKNKDKLDGTEGGSNPSATDGESVDAVVDGSASSPAGGDDIYAIDAAKKKKYLELFPVEAKKFGYTPNTSFKSVEDALDDRVKKKADRYCK
ncbi:PREDICTED: uncharacterized protein LOC104817210 [Tarenaya hassleriana]|uniref:uncharacterized protein LOC104817210 n=1 Tax=Tarenaya hassleriana TaxID=28532 RepID=UPI00053C6E44|nr:PREDICTED: uncharacterized protein LOC104817210 [Tarenaya hassleriana]